MKFIKKTDMIVIAILLAVSAAIWFGYHYFTADRPVRAEIYYRSELVETIDLGRGDEREFSLPQEPDVVLHLYADGEIAFVKSDCPDKICIHTGKISGIGESAACLPNGVLVKIVPANGYASNDPDIVVGK